MELADLETFLVLTEELHFGRTAARVYVTPARVSQRIRVLEKQIGASLFERSSRRVRLTPLGADLRDRLYPLYNDLRAAVQQAQTAAEILSGALRRRLRPMIMSKTLRHPSTRQQARPQPGY